MDFRRPDSVLNVLKRRVATRLGSIFPLGITARLSTTLLAVALLAAAANMIARESVSIVRMVTRSPVRPMQSAPVTPQGAADPTIADAKRFNALTLALGRYDRAVQLRANYDSTAIDSEYLTASAALRDRSLESCRPAPSR